ncbi:hypothetical protein SK128_006408 [Halocaridina rubra]|uniref:Uncharacterized protein n=1 Tax=Halocaridina rubra TaxID=373956 RepID=A0AAN8XI26_HALRR
MRYMGRWKACVVSSRAVTVPWVWPQIQVTSWIPPINTLSNGDSTFVSDFILRLIIRFENEDFQTTHDALDVYNSNVTFTTIRKSFINITSQDIYLPEDGGWFNVTFEVKETYVLKYTGSREPFFTMQFHASGEKVQEVIISGSNVTVNCDSVVLVVLVVGS